MTRWSDAWRGYRPVAAWAALRGALPGAKRLVSVPTAWVTTPMMVRAAASLVVRPVARLVTRLATRLAAPPVVPTRRAVASPPTPTGAGPVLLRLLPTLLLLVAVVVATRPAVAGDRLMVLAGTTLIEDVVRGVGGERVAVRTVIPGAACPGHYDVRASDIAAFARADVILLHDWQRGQSHIRSMLATDAAAEGKVRVPEVAGNWMLPEVQARGITAVTVLLSRADPGGAQEYARNGADRAARALAVGEEVRAAVARAGVAGLPVIADVMQRPLLEWLGLRVVADYGRFEEMGAEALGRTMTAARRAGAVLVVDNLQSTGGAGKALADDIGARHVVLTNFPGGFVDTPDWESSLRRNAALVMEALQGLVTVTEARGAHSTAGHSPGTSQGHLVRGVAFSSPVREAGL